MASFAPSIGLNESLIHELVESTQTAIYNTERTSLDRPRQATALVVFEPLRKTASTPGERAAATDEPRAEQCQRTQEDVQRRFEMVAFQPSISSSNRPPTENLHIGAYPSPRDATWVTPTAPPAPFENTFQRQTVGRELAAAQKEADRRSAAYTHSSRDPVYTAVTVRLFEVDRSDLTTHIDIDIVLTWPDSDLQKPEHSSQACLRLHARNCVPESLRFSQLREHNVPDVLRTLPPGLVSVGQGVTCISVDYTAASVWATNILGDSDFGPYHNDTMNRLRSFVEHGARIHMVLSNALTIFHNAEDFSRHFAKEAKIDPLLRFWSGDDERLGYCAGDLAVQNLEYERIPPLFPSFRDLDDFSTKAMLPLVRDRQYYTELHTSVKLSQRARFVQVPHHPNRLIMLVDQNPKDPLLLQDDMRVTVRIHRLNPTDDPEEYWMGNVEPLPVYARSNDRAFTIHCRCNNPERQWLGGDPGCLEDVIPMEDLTDPESAKRRVYSARPEAVDIYTDLDTKSFSRLERTIEAARDLILRERSADPNGISVTEDIILGNRFDRVPNQDMLESATSEQLASLRAHLKPPQCPVIEALRSMPGGFAYVTGAAGTGKSTSLLIVAAHCANLVVPANVAHTESNLNTDIQQGSDTFEADIELGHPAGSRRPALRMLLTSPLNNNAEQNADAIRDHLLKAGIKDPIVIREYTESTTTALFTTHCPDARHTGKNARRDYDGDAALAELIASIPEAKPDDYHGSIAILEAYNARQKRTFRPDKRVTPHGMKYSVANYAIHVAKLADNFQSGIPDEQVTRLRAMIPNHQITALKVAYLKLKASCSTSTTELIMAKQRTDLAEAFQVVRESILNSADAVSTTCQLACDRSLWLFFRPKIIFLDEAARATFAESLCFVWYPGCRFRIFAGDPLQSRAQYHSPPDVNPLVAHMVLSFASHLHLSGFRTTQLTTTYRFVPSIAGLVSRAFYNGQLACDSLFEPHQRKIHMRIIRLLLRLGRNPKVGAAKSTSPADHVITSDAMDVILLDISKTTTRKTEIDKSSYNEETALAVWALVQLFERGGIPSNELGIVTPYVAQRTLHESVRTSRASRTRQPQDIMIETSERAQGLQRSILFFDVPNTEQLGFLGNTTKLCTGITRCRLGLVVVCDVQKLELVRGFSTKAIGRLIHDLKMQRRVICLNAEVLKRESKPDWFITPNMTTHK